MELGCPRCRRGEFRRRLSAMKPGRARITARAGKAVRSFAVSVVANPIAALRIEPAQSSVRTGEVVPFAVQALARNGRPIGDATPEWSLSPGNGQIDPEGHFVGDVPGSYRVTASFAGKTVDAVVEVVPGTCAAPQP